MSSFVANVDLNVVDDFVSAHGKPKQLSLDEDTHIFHFEERGAWERNAAGLMFVNRNGNHVRLIEDEAGVWHVIKTWTGRHLYDEWMDTRLHSRNLVWLLARVSVGPVGKQEFESLCLLPKEVTTGRRKAVWRGHILDVRFSDAGFELTHPYDEEVTCSFSGKLWESKLAAAWCEDRLHSYAGKLGLSPPAARIQEVATLGALESTPLWGMFG